MKIFKAVVTIISILLIITAIRFNNFKKQVVKQPVEAFEQIESSDLTPFELSWTYYGVKEFASRGDENIIVSFFKDLGVITDNSSTAWCSAFANSMSIRTNYEYSNSLAARSWLNVGKSTEAYPGCIVVLWRESKSSWKGHVGYFLRYNEDKSKVLVYGGNQSNAIVPQWYPSYRVLEFREICPLNQEISEFQISDTLQMYLD